MTRPSKLDCGKPDLVREIMYMRPDQVNEKWNHTESGCALMSMRQREGNLTCGMKLASHVFPSVVPDRFIDNDRQNLTITRLMSVMIFFIITEICWVLLRTTS